MRIQVTGIHLDVGEALRTRVEERMEASVGKYFSSPVDAHVTFARDGHEHRADCQVHIDSRTTVQSRGQAGDIYASFDQAMEKLSKQLRRHKRRLKDHHPRDKQRS